MDQPAKNQALIDIQATLERATPPETLFIDQFFGTPWLYVDGTWIEADDDTHSLFLVPWERAGRLKWGQEFVKRVDLSDGAELGPEMREKLLERSRQIA